MKRGPLIDEIMERENSNDDYRRQELNNTKNFPAKKLKEMLTEYRNRKIDSYFY